jgi:hypothetical protein
MVAEPRSVVRTRWFVGHRLLDHDLPSLVPDVQLVASEMATNAIQHALSPFSVVLQGFDGFVVLAVRDGSLERPRLLTDNMLDAEAGRGMVLVNAMCTEWGTAATADGKSTWAAFDIHNSALPPSEGMGGGSGGDLPGRS